MRVLVIENDRAVGARLVKGLQNAGYSVDWVPDGPGALAALGDTAAGYALALLNWRRRDEVFALKALRAAGHSMAVLIPALRAQVSRDAESTPRLTHGELALDPVTHTLYRGTAVVRVTAREFSLLQILMERPKAVLSRGQLEERLYGWRNVESNAVEFLINRIRKKLGRSIIENVRGVGWRLGHPMS